jgi:CheY-like chemotaxis protein
LAEGSGLAAARKIREIYIEQPIIFISGNAADIEACEFGFRLIKPVDHLILRSLLKALSMLDW